MDPAHSPLGRMLLDEITPVLMILTTPLVEEICQKNGLTFLQMLSPFSSFNNIDVPVRTASDQPYRLRKFKLRIVYASDVRQPDIELQFLVWDPYTTAPDLSNFKVSNLCTTAAYRSVRELIRQETLKDMSFIQLAEATYILKAAEYIAESTGVFTDKDKAAAQLKGGA